MKSKQCERKIKEKAISLKGRSMVMLAIMVFAATLLAGCGRNHVEEDDVEEINWDDVELGDRLPTPPIQ